MMKSTTTLAVMLLLFTTITSSGCMFLEGVDGNGNVIKETRKTGSFDGIRVGGAFNVILIQGDTESVTVEADENLHSIIKTKVKGSILHINAEENIRKSKALNIYVNFKSMDKIDISGACELEASNKLTFSRLNLEASGASEIKLNLNAEFMDIDFSGASEVRLSGEVGRCEFEVSGASEINAYDLVAEEIELRASGASDAKLHATESLRVNASGASSVRYMGNPKIDSNVSGAGSISRR